MAVSWQRSVEFCHSKWWMECLNTSSLFLCYSAGKQNIYKKKQFIFRNTAILIFIILFFSTAVIVIFLRDRIYTIKHASAVFRPIYWNQYRRQSLYDVDTFYYSIKLYIKLVVVCNFACALVPIGFFKNLLP